MALPTTGPISLNQMHVEVGGTSGTTVSINDADIRGLISKASGALMSFSEWYGASAVTNWASTMTVGVFQFKSNPPIYGYAENLYGSLTDDTVDNLNGDTVEIFNFDTGNNTLVFMVEEPTTTDPGNSGFTTLSIGGVNFLRTDAIYTFSSGTPSYQRWQWSSATNPFGTTAGATRSIAMS